jgi:hypothetical protein
VSFEFVRADVLRNVQGRLIERYGGSPGVLRAAASEITEEEWTAWVVRSVARSDAVTTSQESRCEGKAVRRLAYGKHV